MSTFRGIIEEFPYIRIDYFRAQPDAPAPRPLACFLSHIHSDHLQGLEGYYGGPFIYCSEATKELLIRLERRAHRVNFAKKLVEARSFTHVEKKSILKTIPLETPTRIELGNGKEIRVTLFDANHCPGAVMFLIEDEKHSILYTGDIRAEPWWVDWISRHPVMIPYTMGIKTLSRIYLDTSYYAFRDHIDETFPPKAEGIRELISTMMKYPKTTTFHFNTWTFGYEEIWVAMAAAFDEKIHVDQYQHRLFRSIRDKKVSPHGPFLNGFTFGNTSVEGKLTLDPSARIHSCDRNLECEGLRGKDVVWIVPLVNRVGGVEVNEVGIGQGDLEFHSELSLDKQSLEFILDTLGGKMSSSAQEMLKSANHSRSEALPLHLGVEEKITLSILSKMLSEIAESKKKKVGVQERVVTDPVEVRRLWESKIEGSIVADDGTFLPNRIAFPYARHSSHEELRNLVGRFRPVDVYPCVVDEVNWSEKKSMRRLFGDLCKGEVFLHDRMMREMFEKEQEEEEEGELPTMESREVDVTVPLDACFTQVYSDGSQRREEEEEEEVEIETRPVKRVRRDGPMAREVDALARGIEGGENLERIPVEMGSTTQLVAEARPGKRSKSPPGAANDANVDVNEASHREKEGGYEKTVDRVDGDVGDGSYAFGEEIATATSSFATAPEILIPSTQLPSKETTNFSTPSTNHNNAIRSNSLHKTQKSETSVSQASHILRTSSMNQQNGQGFGRESGSTTMPARREVDVDSDVLTHEEEDMDVQAVESALSATLGEGGRSWWDVELESTALEVCLGRDMGREL